MSIPAKPTSPNPKTVFRGTGIGPYGNLIIGHTYLFTYSGQTVPSFKGTVQNLPDSSAFGPLANRIGLSDLEQYDTKGNKVESVDSNRGNLYVMGAGSGKPVGLLDGMKSGLRFEVVDIGPGGSLPQKGSFFPAPVQSDWSSWSGTTPSAPPAPKELGGRSKKRKYRKTKMRKTKQRKTKYKKY